MASDVMDDRYSTLLALIFVLRYNTSATISHFHPDRESGAIRSSFKSDSCIVHKFGLLVTEMPWMLMMCAKLTCHKLFSAEAHAWKVTPTFSARPWLQQANPKFRVTEYILQQNSPRII